MSVLRCYFVYTQKRGEGHTMKKIIIPIILLIGFTQCKKQNATPKYVEKVLYAGDSVRYSLDSLPAQLPTAPPDYNDYYKLVQVYTNNTLVIDYTHILEGGMSVTYRGFVRYQSGTSDFKGWYRRRISNGYIIPANREVVIYRTVPYNGPMDGNYSGQ